MAGNNRIILQQRDLHLLRELFVTRVMDGEQVKVVAGFGSTTRANTRLLALVRAGLLRRFFLGSGGGRKALYSLSAKGAHVAEVPARGPRRPQDALLVADYFVGHQLAVNNLYCALKYGAIPEINLIPDGYVEFATQSGIIGSFLEVDLGHESQSIWKGKAQHYLALALSGKYPKQFGNERFRVLVVANSDRRLHSIRKTVSEITQKIFRFATLGSVHKDFFAPVWFRATEAQPTSLIETTP